VAFIEASLEELPVSANLGQSCLATKISAPGPSSFGWFRHSWHQSSQTAYQRWQPRFQNNKLKLDFKTTKVFERV